ncbi:hypothetical protein D3C83_188340 [compost metagenome]
MRCVDEPVPAEAYAIWPGRARATAMNSFTFFAGTEGWIAIVDMTAASIATGVKSSTPLNDRFL